MPNKSIEELISPVLFEGMKGYGAVHYGEADAQAIAPYIVWSLVDHVMDGEYLGPSGSFRVQVDIYSEDEFSAADIRNRCSEWLRRLSFVEEGIRFFTIGTVERAFRKDEDPFYHGLVDVVINWKET